MGNFTIQRTLLSRKVIKILSLARRRFISRQKKMTKIEATKKGKNYERTKSAFISQMKLDPLRASPYSPALAKQSAPYNDFPHSAKIFPESQQRVIYSARGCSALAGLLIISNLATKHASSSVGAVYRVRARSRSTSARPRKDKSFVCVYVCVHVALRVFILCDEQSILSRCLCLNS